MALIHKKWITPLLLATSNSKSSGNDVRGVCSGVVLAFDNDSVVSAWPVARQGFGASVYFDSDIIRSLVLLQESINDILHFLHGQGFALCIGWLSPVPKVVEQTPARPTGYYQTLILDALQQP
ncbi:MAG: hypothetical protein QMB92_11180 [Thiopseudomonas sp.]|nr:hypothetical protein [Gammaproteobacteria bacterium]